MDLVDFNSQKRGRLTLIRDFLDRLPLVKFAGDRSVSALRQADERNSL
jgi:hypothetical protein